MCCIRFWLQFIALVLTVTVCCELVGFASLQDSMGGSPNDIRISDMRPTLVEPPIYKPKVVLLGKDKKGRFQTYTGGQYV